MADDHMTTLILVPRLMMVLIFLMILMLFLMMFDVGLEIPVPPEFVAILSKCVC